MSAVATSTVPNAGINPKMIVPFVNSVRQVFSTMVGVQTIVERPTIKIQPAVSYDVSAIIGFSGNVIGSVVVSFQAEAAKKLVESFCGSALEITSPDFADAIGELANMITGSAKKDLGVTASISVPSVVVGPGHVIARIKDVPCVVVPCKTPMGDFAVEISIKVVQQAA